MSYDRRAILKLMGLAATAVHKPAVALAEATKASALAVSAPAALAEKAKRRFFHVPDSSPAPYREAMSILEAEMHGWHREDNDWDGGYVVPVDLMPFKSMSLDVKLTEHRRRKREDAQKRSVAHIAHNMLKKKLHPKEDDDEDVFP